MSGSLSAFIAIVVVLACSLSTVAPFAPLYTPPPPPPRSATLETTLLGPFFGSRGHATAFRLADGQKNLDGLADVGSIGSKSLEIVNNGASAAASKAAVAFTDFTSQASKVSIPNDILRPSLSGVKDVTFQIAKSAATSYSSLPATVKYVPPPETISGWETLKGNLKAPSVSLPTPGVGGVGFPNVDQAGLEKLKANLGGGSEPLATFTWPDFNWPQGGVHSLVKFSQWLNNDIDDTARTWLLGGESERQRVGASEARRTSQNTV